jgi:DNA sulfur modification protein DndC
MVSLKKIRSKCSEVIKQIQAIYLQDNRPWVVGYSGGKDSTAVIQLIFEALTKLPPERLQKDVYVLSSDTLVETPVIIDFLNHNLDLIAGVAQQLHLPIRTIKVKPELEKSFWVLLIGKGYPTPRQKFRWCTDRLKIEPTNRFILDRISEYGEVIMVLGVRKAESPSRNQVLKNHKVKGRILRRHSVLTNAYVYSPIEDFTVQEVWAYLLQNPSPWGGDNYTLFSLYQDSNADECPLVIDKNSPSCGNSRFGCWVCTVVREDKSLKGIIESGRHDLIPLLKYRNWLQSIRENKKYREDKRMNGSVYYVGEGTERRRGFGPFNLEARREMLQKLLVTQEQVGFPLISEDELKIIRRIWIEQGDWEDSLPRIYQQVCGDSLDWSYDERPFLSENELMLLDTLCEEEGIPSELIHKLIAVELEYYGFKHRHGIFKSIDKIMHEEWIHIPKGADSHDISG